MFHVKLLNSLKNLKIHELLFYVFLFLIPIQTRILYKPESAYINWYFSYHLAYFLYFTDILLITCFIAWFVFDRPQIDWTKNRLFRHILVFFALILATLFNVKHIGLGLYEALKWLEMLFLLTYIYLNFKSVKQFHNALWVLFVSGVSQAIIGILQFHKQHSLNLGFLGEYVPPLGTSGLATIDTVFNKFIRAYGTFPHPNVLAGFLILALFSAFYLVSRETSVFRKVLVSCGTFLILLGLFFTFSRIAWIAAIFVLICFATYHLKLKNRGVAGIIGIILIVSCATIVLTLPNLIQSRVKKVLQTRSVSDRIFFNQLALDTWKNQTILGTGVGNYIPAMLEKYKLEPWQYQPPHNIFLFIAVELGVLGLGLFVIIVTEIFKIVITKWRELLPFTLLVGGVALFILGNFDHYFITIQQGQLTLFTFLGLAAASKNFSN